jgi:glutathione reductase (NADPH)
MNEYPDLVVIGGGSGGVAAARRAASHGAKVVLVEQDRLGGTCVIRGCIPKKLMMYASRIGGELRQAAPYGWTIPEASFDMAAWQDAKAREIDRLEAIYADLLAKSGVSVIAGHAGIESPGSVRVNGELLRTRRILIASGGSPVLNALPGAEAAATSNEILNLRTVPHRLGVMGAGYIALEFASILAGLGSEVSLFFRDSLPLRGFDQSVRERLSASLQAQGIRLFPGSQFEQVQASDQGATLHASGAAHHFDVLLNALGRRPNTAGLGLDKLGLTLSSEGAIPVDEWNETQIKGVFAIGDVTHRKNLTPVAIAEGRAFAENTFNGQRLRVDYASIATATFTNPPLASVGLPEHEALLLGKLRIYEAEFRPMKTAFAGSDAKAFMKLIVQDSSDRVLGIHMLGDDSPEIVQSLALAYAMGAKKSDFDRTVAVHPTLAEEFMLMREPTRMVTPG